MVSLLLAAMAATVYAQEVPSAFVASPNITRTDLAASRFWTRGTIALVALDGAAKTADSLATRRNIDGGGDENNPLARPFVHAPLVQVSATAALFGTEIATAYLLHRKHHDKLGRVVLAVGAAMNGLGAASSIKHR